MKPELLRTQRLCLARADAPGLREVNLFVRQGDFVTLLGLHDSGKDALCELFRGGARPQSGRVYWMGQQVQSFTQDDWEARRAAYIGPEAKLIRSFDLAENLFLLRKTSLRKVFVNKAAIHTQTDSLLKKYGLPFSPGANVGDITPAQQNLVAIAKAADQGARLIVLHNLATGYSLFEINELQLLLNRVKARGVTFIAAENRPEIYSPLSDCMVAVRKDRIVMKLYDMARVKDAYRAVLDEGTVQAVHRVAASGPPLLVVENLRLNGENPLPLSVAAGEMVQVSTMDSVEHARLWDLLSLCRPSGHWLRVEGQDLLIKARHEFTRHRILVEDFSPRHLSVFYNLHTYDNVLMPVQRRIRVAGLFTGKQYRDVLRRDPTFLGRPLEDRPLKGMTRNELLALLVARWKVFNPKVVLLHNAFSTADVVGKEILWQGLCALAERGTAVLTVESDIIASAAYAHRLLLVKNGKLSAERQVNGTNLADLGLD